LHSMRDFAWQTDCHWASLKTNSTAKLGKAKAEAAFVETLIR